jgi:hypothetical protein
VANDIITGLRDSERRRTVSEGGGLTSLRSLMNEFQRDDDIDGGAALREDHTERIGDGGIDETNEARRRWRWIRKVFTGKD